MGSTLYVTGAYWRKASRADWDAGLDFKIIGGPYCSKRDAAAMLADGYVWVVAHYQGKQVFSINLYEEE